MLTPFQEVGGPQYTDPAVYAPAVQVSEELMVENGQAEASAMELDAAPGPTAAANEDGSGAPGVAVSAVADGVRDMPAESAEGMACTAFNEEQPLLVPTGATIVLPPPEGPLLARSSDNNGDNANNASSGRVNQRASMDAVTAHDGDADVASMDTQPQPDSQSQPEARLEGGDADSVATCAPAPPPAAPPGPPVSPFNMWSGQTSLASTLAKDLAGTDAEGANSGMVAVAAAATSQAPEPPFVIKLAQLNKTDPLKLDVDLDPDLLHSHT